MGKNKEYLIYLEEKYGKDLAELKYQHGIEEQELYFSRKFEVKINGKTLIGTEEQLVEYLQELIKNNY